MADDKKKKKKKEAAPAADAAPEPAPAAAEEKRGSSRGSKKAAKRTGSNVFSMFSQTQVAEFKEGFSLMDADKDGVLGKNDLRGAFDMIGRLVSDKELDEMLNEAPGPISFTQLLTLFAERMSGGSDDDEVVIAAFKAFDMGNGKIDSEQLRQLLMTFGDKFSSGEVDDAFDQMVIDDGGKIDMNHLIGLLCAKKEEGEEGAGEGEAA